MGSLSSRRYRALWPGLYALSFFVAVGCAPKAPQLRLHEQLHPNGTPRLRLETRNGVPHGTAIRWHESGAMAHRGQYESGVRVGLFLYWDTDGTWLRAEFYERGDLRWKSRSTSDLLHSTVPPEPTKHHYVGDKVSGWLAEQGQKWPALFPMMPASSRRQEIALALSLREIVDGGSKTSLRRFSMSASAPLAPFGYSSLGLYGVFASSNAAVEGNVGTPGRSTWELGARWTPPRRAFAVRFGLGFPVGDDEIDEHTIAVQSLQLSPHDQVMLYPRSMAIRASIAHAGRSGFLQHMVDTGIDVAMDAFGDSDLAMQESVAMISRSALAVGTSLNRLGISTNLAAIYPFKGAGLDDFQLSIGVAAQLRARWFSPAFTVVRPLKDSSDATVYSISLAFLHGKGSGDR